MLSLMSRLRDSHSLTEQANQLYITLVTRARNPNFYTKLGVADSLDGRFEIIVLHMFLVLRRLQGEREQWEFSRRLIEIMFDDMDRSLREMGVGDTGVGRRIKAMVEAFYGRRAAYDAALALYAIDPVRAGGMDALKAALTRNVYGAGEPPREDQLTVMSRYVLAQAHGLTAMNTQQIRNANLDALARAL